MKATLQPNIIFIMTDQQRQDSLSCYGNNLIQTPAIDKLALEAATFDHFYVNNPVCVPSRCSFLTGRYPSAHRSRDLSFALDSSENHLFQILKASGYLLGLCGKNHVLNESELHKFDYIYEKGHNKTKHLNNKPYSSHVDPTPIVDYSTKLITENAKNFITEAAKDTASPFCLWVSFPDPHTPFQVPEPYASIIKTKRKKPQAEPILNDNKPLSQRLIRDLQGLAEATPHEIEQMVNIYHGMISFIDDSVGEIMSLLDSLELDSNTIVIFTSDHGEYLGDHEMVRKSWHFYDCLLQVPFMIRWKGKIKPQRISHTMVESIDMLPTLLDYLDLPMSNAIQGSSVFPMLQGLKQNHRSFVFAEAGNPGESFQVQNVEEWNLLNHKPGPLWYIGAVQGCMIRTMEWKLCHYANGEGELYHLKIDSDETNNVFNQIDYVTEQLHLSQLLIMKMMKNQDPRHSDGDRFELNHA